MTVPLNIDINALHLDKGAHLCFDGQCLMEARALLLGLPKNDDRQPGVSPVLHAMGIALNDTFPDDRRQELKRFLPKNGVDPLAGTDDGRDEARGYLALDWLVRTYAPAFLDLRPELVGVAAELRGLPRLANLAVAVDARPIVAAARAAWAAARAAGAADDGAAWDAARAAVRDAAGDAAWDAAGAAFWAVRAAAGDAARAAAWDAARDAGDAARAAARAAGAPLGPPLGTPPGTPPGPPPGTPPGTHLPQPWKRSRPPRLSSTPP